MCKCADDPQHPAKMRTYFAYGSNLCLPRLISRVPSARFVAIAKLPDFKLTFHKRSEDGSGKATVVMSPKETVYGALFEFEDMHLDALRKAEGYPKHYSETENFTFNTLDGECKAMTYVATQQFFDTDQVPYDWYVDLIRFGARRLGLPESYVTQFDTIVTKQDQDLSRAARERSFLR
jgi:hypothetical protein